MIDGYKNNNKPSKDRAGGPDGAFLGLVTDGSLANGVEVRLDSDTSIEDVKVGAFVTIQRNQHRFFGVATDVALGL